MATATTPAVRAFMDLDDKQFRTVLAGSERRTRSTAANMNRSFGTLDKSLGGVTRRLTALGPLLSTLTIGAVFTSVVRSTANFEKGLSDLSAITGATGKDLAFLEAAAKRLGRETTRSAVDTLTAFKLVGSAKPDLLTNVDALTKVTEAAITLSEASGTELPEAAGTLTTALNQFGAGADEAARFINVLAAGAQKGAVEVGPFSTALTKAGTVAKDAGVSFEEFTATIQTLATFGTPLEQVGTSVRNILLRMQEGADDTNPAIVGLDQALINLGRKLKTTADFTKRFGLENVVVAKQMVATVQQVRTMTSAITGTNQAVEQAETRTDNLKDDLGKLGIAFDNLATSIGGGASGPLRDFIQLLTDGVNITAEFIDEVQSLKSIVDELFAGERPGLLPPLLNLPKAEFQREAALQAFREQQRGPRTRTPLRQSRPPVIDVGDVADVGVDDATAKKRETALKQIENTIRGLEDEARVASTVAGEREKLAAILSLENTARDAGIKLTDEQIARATAAVSITQQQAKEEERLAAVQARESELAGDIEDLRLRLKFAGMETEEYRVQARLLEIRRDLGAGAAAAMEAEVRQAERLTTSLAELTEIRAEQIRETEKLTSVARDLGLTFTSAFEDAVIAGEDVRNVLQGIFQDIQRLILRKGFTEPLLEGLVSGAGGRVTGGAGQAAVSGFLADLTSPLRSGAPTGTVAPPPPKPPIPASFTNTVETAELALMKMGEAGVAAGGSLSSSLAPAAIRAATETGLETAATTAATSATTTETAATVTATSSLAALASAASVASAALMAMSASAGSGGGGPGLPFSAAGFLITGSRHEGGPVTAGQTYLVKPGEEFFTPGASGFVTPAEMFEGGGGDNMNVTVIQNNALGIAQTVRAELAAALPRLRAEAIAAVVDAKQRGGGFARAFS